MNYFVLGLIVLIYLFMLAGISWYAYRNTKNANDYMIGGGNMSSTVMALSYGATFISASAIVGFGGVSAAYGMGIQWLCMLNILVGVIIAFIFFGKNDYGRFFLIFIVLYLYSILLNLILDCPAQLPPGCQARLVRNYSRYRMPLYELNYKFCTSPAMFTYLLLAVVFLCT